MIRCLVVDDEAPARAKLRRLLAAAEGFAVVGDAADGDAAIDAIRRLEPDVVFLDVQMPRRDGFGVVRAIGPEQMPPTVFVTAFDEHALQAFEVEAIDYLLKPFASQRFARLLDRLRRRFARRETAELSARLARLLDQVRGPAPAAPPALDSDRQTLLPVERIDVVRADGNHVRLIGPDGTFRRRGTLAQLAERLDPDDFLQVNRSEIVRLEAIVEIQPWFRGDYRIVLADGSVLSWSRRFRAKAPADLRG